MRTPPSLREGEALDFGKSPEIKSLPFAMLRVGARVPNYYSIIVYLLNRLQFFKGFKVSEGSCSSDF